MDLKFSKVTRKGPVTIITLSRPEVYNALHIDAHFELNKAVSYTHLTLPTIYSV